LLTKKKEGFRDIKSEFQYLEDVFNTGNVVPSMKFEWEFTLKVIEFLEKKCTLDQIQKVYDAVLMQQTRYCSFNVFCHNHRLDDESLDKTLETKARND